MGTLTDVTELGVTYQQTDDMGMESPAGYTGFAYYWRHIPTNTHGAGKLFIRRCAEDEPVRVAKLKMLELLNKWNRASDQWKYWY